MGIIRIPRRRLMALEEGDRAALKGAPPVPMGATGADLLNAGVQYTDGSDVWHLFADLSYRDEQVAAVRAREPEAVGAESVPLGWGELRRIDGGAWTVLNVKDYGLKGDDTPEDAGRVTAMLNDAISRRSQMGVELFWPAGSYRIPGPIAITAQANYEFYKLRMRGAGKDQTRIRTTLDAANLFEFYNDVGYSAQLSFHGIQFHGADTAVYAENCYYSEFVDCGFRGNGLAGGYSVLLAGTAGLVRMHNCWAFHTRNVLYTTGPVSMAGCDFGEDAGGIYVAGPYGSLVAVGCRWSRDTFFRNPPDGRTEAAIIVGGDRGVSVAGCEIWRDNGRPFLDADWPNDIVLSANRYTFGSLGGSIASVARPHRGVAVRGGTVYTIADMAVMVARGGNVLKNCEISDLAITNPNDSAVFVPDEFFDPQYRNIYRNNRLG